jgi:hypothetical protein
MTQHQSLVNEAPTLMSPPMVRATLNGVKDQTRRIITRRNSFFDGGKWPNWVKDDAFDWQNAFIDQGPSPAGNSGPYLKLPWPSEKTVHRIYPRYQVGQHLWIKETWRTDKKFDQIKPILLSQGSRILYEADYQDECPLGGRIRQSIFMRRWMSRITLEITDMRLEQLQNISEKDAVQEGCFKGKASGRVFENQVMMQLGGPQWATAKDWYADLWDTINGDRSWDKNPWVWVIGFKRVKP